MKYNLFIISVLLLISCGNQKNEKTTVNKTDVKKGIPTIDVTKTYPHKEIVLQDIADVEYIPLETTEECLIDRSKSIVYSSKDTIIIHNTSKGDFMFFNGKGKFLSKFNRRGQSGREYIRAFNSIFDRERQELFVYENYKTRVRILVYDKNGNYKRTLPVKSKQMGNFINFDKDNLLEYESYGCYSSQKNRIKKNLTPFMLVSKTTGKIDTLKQIKLEDRDNKVMRKSLGKDKSMSAIFVGGEIISLSKQLFVLNDDYADTVYTFSTKRELKPILIKTPAFKTQKDKKILLRMNSISEKWMFLTTQLKDIDFATKKFPKPNYLVINRETNSINEVQFINKDMGTKKPYYNNFVNADDLIELLEEGKLKGKLKTIAENLKEDDNPVLIKVTLKSISN